MPKPHQGVEWLNDYGGLLQAPVRCTFQSRRSHCGLRTYGPAASLPASLRVDTGYWQLLQDVVDICEVLSRRARTSATTRSLLPWRVRRPYLYCDCCACGKFKHSWHFAKTGGTRVDEVGLDAAMTILKELEDQSEGRYGGGFTLDLPFGRFACRKQKPGLSEADLGGGLDRPVHPSL